VFCFQFDLIVALSCVIYVICLLLCVFVYVICCTCCITIAIALTTHLNSNNLIQFNSFFIYVPSQQLRGQLQTQHGLITDNGLQVSTGGKSYQYSVALSPQANYTD
jgi:hypothetical protein